jgi:hypothetical protein
MDNTQREIRNEIEATRAGMVEKIATLEDRVDSTIRGVKRSFDPKFQTEQHPWLFLGLSVVAGYLFSGLILSRPSPKTELVLPDGWDERMAARQRNAGLVQSLASVLTGVVTATATSLARDITSRTLFKHRQNGRDSQDPSRPAPSHHANL